MSPNPLVVVGDLLLDADVVGTASRLAPDAPVPVVDVEHEVLRPGGAGLAALLAARAGGREVVLVAPVSDDADGERLADLVRAAGVRLVAVPRTGRTVVKRRVRVQGRSLLRLDSGGPGRVDVLPPPARDVLADAAAVLVSDYGTGATAGPTVRDALAQVRAPVVWDPHPRGTAPVPGAALVTPNEAEARALSDALLDRGAADRAGPAGSADPADLADLARRGAALVDHWAARAVSVTLGRRGALLSRGDEPPVVVPPAVTAADGDPCGAGDCFATTAALALADGAVVPEAVEAAVHAAARFVQAGGASALEPAAGDPRAPRAGTTASVVDRVRAAGGTVVATGGCFDLLHAGHVETLRAARSLGDCLVVLLNSDDSVRRLKGPERPIVPQADRARVLEALDPVDAVVVFDEQTPVEAIRRLRPDVWAKGGDYSVQQLPEAEVLAEWGGQTVVLPYLDGRSTTRLVAEARAAAQR